MHSSVIYKNIIIYFAIIRNTVLFVVCLCKVFYELKQTHKYLTRNKP